MKEELANFFGLAMKYLNKATSQADKLDSKDNRVIELRKDLFQVEDYFNKLRRMFEIEEEEKL